MSQRTATILSGQTTSNAVDLRVGKIVSFYFGAFTGTAMTFISAPTEDGPFVDVYDDDNNILTITVGPNRCVPITNSVKSLAAAGMAWAKLISGSTEVAERTVEVISK